MSAESVVQQYGALILLATLGLFAACRVVDTALALKRHARERDYLP